MPSGASIATGAVLRIAVRVIRSRRRTARTSKAPGPGACHALPVLERLLARIVH